MEDGTVREQDRRQEMSWKAFGGEAQVQVVSLAGNDLPLGQPCRSISKRVKSVTIKNKTWGSLKGPRGPFRSLPVAVTQARMPLPSTLQGDFVKVALKGVFRQRPDSLCAALTLSFKQQIENP